MLDQTLPADQPFGYVVFNPDTRALIESCYQVPPSQHLGCLIPVDDEVRANWLQYRANEALDGVELLPPSEPISPPVPQQVTMRQARLALLQAGLLVNVDAAIDSLASPDREVARIEWDYSSMVERSRPLVSMIGTALGLDAAGIDDLFVAAGGM